MPKRIIKGILKNDSPEPSGYREPWNTGRAALAKRVQKIKGINRPST
ncbi:hypothetical protein JOC37_002043 [Desulfohalotomaculum tongense]|nr:hypothetical protein [Desulforadius tongensis]MBM7855641.1 hypothetical protein [Desulforadius tongensis]